MAANDKPGATGEPRVPRRGLDDEEAERLAAKFKPAWESVGRSQSEPAALVAPPAPASPKARIRQTTLVGLAPGASQAQAAALPAHQAEYTPPMPPAAKVAYDAGAAAQSVEVRDELPVEAPEPESSASDAESSSKIPTVPPKPRESSPNAVVQLHARDLVLIVVTVIALVPIFIVGVRTLLAPAPTTRVVYQTVTAEPRAPATENPQMALSAPAPSPRAEEAPSAASTDAPALAASEERERVQADERTSSAQHASEAQAVAHPAAQAPTPIDAQRRQPKKPTSKKTPTSADSPVRSSTAAPGGSPIVRETPF